MHAASRDALDQTREALKSALAADPAGGATGAKAVSYTHLTLPTIYPV